MKKDIQKKSIDHLRVFCAITEQEGKPVLEAYLKNEYDFPLHNVLVSSKGYGVRNGRQAVTAPLRRFFEKLESGQVDFIETIPDIYLDLYSEFWISCNINGEMHDDKFIIIPHAHTIEDLHEEVELDGKKAIIIQAGKAKD